jgi:hypothetical protein
MLETITPVNDVFRRDVEVLVEDLVDPNDPTALQQGEWVIYDATTPNKVTRVTGAVATDRGAMQVFSQKGDLAAQALKKVAVLQLHEYEADTTIFEDNLPGALIGAPLTVDLVTVDGVANVSALRVAGGGDLVFGHITRLPADNGGKLRFQKSYTGAVLP